MRAVPLLYLFCYFLAKLTRDKKSHLLGNELWWIFIFHTLKANISFSVYIQFTCIKCFLTSFFFFFGELLEKNILLFYALHAPFSWKKSPGKQISMAAILPRLNVKTLSLVPIRMTAWDKIIYCKTKSWYLWFLHRLPNSVILHLIGTLWHLCLSQKG